MKIKQTYIDVKRQNAPLASLEAIYALIERVAGKTYAERVILKSCDDDALRKVKATKIVYKTEENKQKSFVENVMETVTQ